MATPSGADAATEALIAQMVADDEDHFGLSLHGSSRVGASYHDYEDPITSYERQSADSSSEHDDDGCNPITAPSLDPVPANFSPQSPLEVSPNGGWDISEAQGNWSDGVSEHHDKTIGKSEHNDLNEIRSAPAAPSSHQDSLDVLNSPSSVSDPNAYAATFPRAERNSRYYMSEDPPGHVDGSVDFRRRALEQDSNDDKTSSPRTPKRKDKGKGREPAFTEGWGESSQHSSYYNNKQWDTPIDEGRELLQQILRDGEYFDENDNLHLVVPWPYPESDQEKAMREDSEVVEIHLGEEDESSDITAMNVFSSGEVKMLGEAVGC